MLIQSTHFFFVLLASVLSGSSVECRRVTRTYCWRRPDASVVHASDSGQCDMWQIHMWLVRGFPLGGPPKGGSNNGV